MRRPEFVSQKLRRRRWAEAALWTAGLAAVAIADPTAPPLIDACLFKAAGLPYCPGCGLGHAIGFLARGEILLALQSHPFAPVVPVIMINRVFQLLRANLSDRNEPSAIRFSHVQSHQIPA